MTLLVQQQAHLRSHSFVDALQDTARPPTTNISATEAARMQLVSCHRANSLMLLGPGVSTGGLPTLLHLLRSENL